MKTLVTYLSHAGGTQKYAETIANRVGGDVLPLKKLKSKVINDYDNIVFGGWVNNGEIKGLNDFLSLWDDMKEKNVIVFSNGVSFPSKEGRTALINQNLLNIYHLRFYQLRGSFDLNKLKFPYSMIVKMVIKKVEGDPNASPEQKAFAEMKDRPIEYFDEEGINKICDVIGRLNVIDVEAKDK